MIRSATSLLVSLVVSVAVGIGAVLWTLDRLDADPDSQYAAGDRVQTAVDALADDPVYVAPDGRRMLDEAGEAEIERLVAERDLPVRVVVWSESGEAGYDHYIQAAEQISYHLGEPGILVLWQGSEATHVEVSEGYALGYVGDSYDRPADLDPLGDADLRIPEYLAGLPDDPLEERTWDYYGGPVGGFFVGLLYALPVVLGVWIVIGIARVSTGRRFLNRPVEARRRPTGKPTGRPPRDRKAPAKKPR